VDLWAEREISQMLVGQGVIGCPIPMDETDEAPIGFDVVMFIRPCLVCGNNFKKKSFCVTSCRCIYHAFCLGAHLEIFKGSTCISCNCNKPFQDGMIEPF
jgi:hypothetical protein